MDEEKDPKFENNDKPRSEKKPEKVLEFFDTKKEPRKSLSNFHRNQFRLLTTNLAMADRKAMIMIRQNAILVSAMIVFKEFVLLNVENGAYIILVMVIGGTISLILSLLAASPSGGLIHWLAKQHIMKEHPEMKEHCMFLFKKCDITCYEKAIREVVNSQDLQIGNQTRIFYVFSQYLLLKYSILDWAFRIFLCSIFIAIAIFLSGHWGDCPFTF